MKGSPLITVSLTSVTESIYSRMSSMIDMLDVLKNKIVGLSSNEVIHE
jgi:hypothetical protein